MKIIVDENIPLSEEAFSGLGKVTKINGRKIDNGVLKDTDVLIVRSITKINEALLRNTKVKFVGTATTGDDHIDIGFLKNSGIRFANAKGCNANSVAEYLFCSIVFALSSFKDCELNSIGIVGYGTIGKKVASIAECLGLKVLINDPPLQRKESGNNKFLSLKDVLQADIVSFHTPLNIGGIDNTFHLLDKDNIKYLQSKSILINTSRGEVIDSSILLDAKERKSLKYILDVWENEPEISTLLLEKSEIGTPHIAGYSYEGKVNGTKIIYDELCKYLNVTSNWNPRSICDKKINIEIESNRDVIDFLLKLSVFLYDVKYDSDNLKKNRNNFDLLRKEYRKRLEFSNYRINQSEQSKQFTKLLDVLRIDKY